MELTEAQKQLVENNHKLIYSFLNKYNYNIEELYDLAAIGMCNAAATWNSATSKFSTYAYVCMLNIIQNYWKVKNAQHRIPDDKMCSLDEPLPDAYDTDCFYELHPAPGSLEDDVILAEMCNNYFQQISERDKTILSLLYLGYNQEYISSKLGCARTTVSYVKRKFLKYLKE